MKMKTKTKITSIFMLALLATACSNGDDPVNGGQDGEDKSEILLRTTVMTRASMLQGSRNPILLYCHENNWLPSRQSYRLSSMWH